MTQLGDFHVKDPVGGSGSGQPRARIIAIAVVVLVAFAAGVYWFLGRGEETPPVETVVEAPPPVVPPPPAPVVPEPEPEPIEVPGLDESDDYVRTVAAALSSHPGLVAWLANDRIIRRVVVAVENIADGPNPSEHVAFMRPRARFATVGEGEALRVDPASYQRYDLHAQIIGSLDTQGTAELFRTMEPLLNDAYVELGNPDRPFVSTLERAIVNLLNVPIIDTPPSIVEYAPYFHYRDERLEALSPAQKQLLGMGPDNVRTIQAKLRQIAIAVGIPDARLP